MGVVDFRNTLEVSVNADGTYSYCETQEDLADNEVKVLDFEESVDWLYPESSCIHDKVMPYIDEAEQLVIIARALSKEGKITLTTEY